MKLQQIPETSEPSYPSFDEYRSGRREYLRTMAIGTGALLLGGGWGCKKEPEVTGGVAAPPPTHTAGTPAPPIDPGQVPQPPGEPPPPKPVLKQPVEIEGDIAMPEPPPKPVTLTPAEVPSPAGGIRAPALQPEHAVKGEMPAPTPAPKVRGRIAAPRVEGLMVMPEPKPPEK